MNTVKHLVDTLPRSETARDRREKRLIPIIASVATLSMFYFAGKAIFERNDTPTFSDSTHSYTFDTGEGLYDAAGDVQNASSVDQREIIGYIEELPKNRVVLTDGIQIGDTIVVPDSVTSD